MDNKLGKIKQMNHDDALMNSSRIRTIGFTLIELLVVIAIIGILASLTVGLTRSVSQKQKLASVQANGAAIEIAIVSYQNDLGNYPPDNLLRSNPKIINAGTNQLYYELVGCRLSRGVYRTGFGDELRAGRVPQLFHQSGLANVVVNQGETPKSFIDISKLKANQVGELALAGDAGGSSGIKVLAVGIPAPGALPTMVNPWKYNSSNPTNSVGGFDLWCDFQIGNQTYLNMGNWNGYQAK